MRNDNKLECKEEELNARDSQNLLALVLSDPVYVVSPYVFSISFEGIVSTFHLAFLCVTNVLHDTFEFPQESTQSSAFLYKSTLWSVWSRSTHHKHLNIMAPPAVFVTGGNSGIGAAMCKLLVSERGCKVFMGSRSVEKGQNAVKEMGLGDKAGDITVVQCDVNVSSFLLIKI